MKDYSRFTLFNVEQDGKVGIVTMNRPESLNAFDREMHGQMDQLFVELAGEDAVEAFVLTGAGRAFCPD